MIFFNKNTKHDKQFLELQTRLNYAYWVASDAHHYFENSENTINTYEYKKLVKQFNSSIEMVKDISISSINLGHVHAQCLRILKKYVLECINELNFSKNIKLKDSESEEIDMMNQLQIQENFVDRTQRGRILTSDGWNYLGLTIPKNSFVYEDSNISY